MATGVVSAPAVNGAHVPSASDLAEYGKIIRLRDLVLSGQHPKLKPNPQSSAANSTTAAIFNSQAIASNNAVHASLASSNAAVNQTMPQAAAVVQPNGQLMPAALSGLDPVTLEKSPLLIATEKNLSQLELEDAIHQEVKRRAKMWPKLDRENILPDFDVGEILRKAQEAVKPILIDVEKLAQREKSVAGSDESSYYSSQGNDEEAENAHSTRAHNATKPCVWYFKGKCIKGKDCKFSHDPAFAAQLKFDGPLTDLDRSYATTGANGPSNKRQKRDDGRNNQHQNSGAAHSNDESSASAKRRADEQYQRDLARSNNGPQYGGYHEARNGAVVHSTINSPLAPQPARVSPLAMKGPPYVEKPPVNGSNGSFLRVAPTAPQQLSSANSQPLPRKRRREAAQPSQEGTSVRRRIASPEIRVKDEPSSPKPIDAVPRYVPREEMRHPVDVDAYGRDVRIQPRPVREIHYIDEPNIRGGPNPLVRVVSRAEPRYEPHKEPDLRRVVSERQILHPGSPSGPIREPVYYNDFSRPGPQGARELVSSRSDADLQRSYRGSVAPGAPPQSDFTIDSRRAQSPGQLQGGPMAPPPPTRTIILDRYGNQYEQLVAEPPRYSVAPEGRHLAQTSYIDRPASRVGSAVPEPSRQYRGPPPPPRRLDDEPTSPRYEIPPPQGSVRASSVAPVFREEYAPGRNEVVRINEYPRDERYERVVREVVAPGGYAERPREVYYEDLPRDGAYRTQSVRPEQARYVEADERFIRQTSTRPLPAGYERVAPSMAPPPPPRFEYADGRAAREYSVSGHRTQYIE